MKIKLFVYFVLSLPFSFIYILIYLVIAFSLRLKSVKIVFNILFFFFCWSMVCIVLTCITTLTNFWHLIIFFFLKKAKYNLLTYLLNDP